jgi:hypothetical protein
MKRFALGVLLLSGCAMNPLRFEALSAEVAARNERARAVALQALLAREGLTDGYGPRWATSLSLDCAREADLAEVMTLLRHGDGSRERLAFTPGDLARLCADHQLVLDATLDGAPVKATVARPLSWARDARGALVSYSLERHVVRRDAVLVRQSCDHMPHVMPPPPLHVIVTQTVEVPVRHVVGSTDVQELDVTCTENTY